MAGALTEPKKLRTMKNMKRDQRDFVNNCHGMLRIIIGIERFGSAEKLAGQRVQTTWLLIGQKTISHTMPPEVDWTKQRGCITLQHQLITMFKQAVNSVNTQPLP
ncbi:hypothetical protein PI124_g11888 [Phytophthora idaei]|nr:hypothetical protein PI126_g10611 [Phytophthora idaei]KAG3243292.1 hypothetical protein PI124_g11888 [Phytophthora idaei]